MNLPDDPDKLIQWAKEIIASRPKDWKFEPFVWYNAHGDILECVISEKGYYAEYVTKNIDVLRAHDGDEIVGFVIWGVKKVIADGENLSQGVEDGAHDGSGDTEAGD